MTPNVARGSTTGQARRFDHGCSIPVAPVVKPRATGFTLVEVLVAIVVFALIGLASSAVVNSMLRTNEQSAEVRERLQQLQQAMLIMENDFRMVASRKAADGKFSVRTGWFNPGNLLARSELQPVSYYVNDQQQLIRQHYNYVDSSPMSEPTERVLLEGVTDFRGRPIVRGEVDGSEAFREEMRNSDGIAAIPDGMEVTIETEQWGTIVRVFLAHGGDFREPQPSP